MLLFRCLFEFRGWFFFFFFSRDTSPFALPFPFILSLARFYVFSLPFSLYFRERGAIPARPHCPVQREDTNWSAERRCRTMEVARLVSTAYTAIRPSYTSAATRAAPSPRRPSSLLSPCLALFSHSPILACRRRCQRRCVSSRARRDATRRDCFVSMMRAILRDLACKEIDDRRRYIVT